MLFSLATPPFLLLHIPLFTKCVQVHHFCYSFFQPYFLHSFPNVSSLKPKLLPIAEFAAEFCPPKKYGYSNGKVKSTP